MRKSPLGHKIKSLTGYLRRVFHSDGNTVRRHLDRLHAGTFTGPTGMFRQRTELSKPQCDPLAKLDIPAPRQIIELAPARR